MITLIISAVSLVVVLTVTVVMINNYYEHKSALASEIRKVVDQTNATNKVHQDIDKKQEDNVKIIGGNIDTVQKDVKSVYDRIQQDYVTKKDLAKSVTSESGQFGSMNIAKNFSFVASGSNNSVLNVKAGETNVMGFDGSKGVLIGSDITFDKHISLKNKDGSSLSFDKGVMNVGGDLSVQGSNLYLGGFSNAPVLSSKNGKLTMGGDVMLGDSGMIKFSDKDGKYVSVKNGNLETSGTSFMLTGLDTLSTSNNILHINKSKKYESVNVGGELLVSDIKSLQSAKGMNLKIGNENVVTVGGSKITLNKPVQAPQVNVGDKWGVVTDKGNNLQFKYGFDNAVSIESNGNVSSRGSGMYAGDVQGTNIKAQRDVVASGNVVGNNLCASFNGQQRCLTYGDIDALTKLARTPTSSSTTTSTTPSTTPSTTANPACPRPKGWCTHPGSTYKAGDCIGDGIQGDHFCWDKSGSRGSIMRTNNCKSIWPNAPVNSCPRLGLPPVS